MYDLTSDVIGRNNENQLSASLSKTEAVRFECFSEETEKKKQLDSPKRHCRELQ